MDIGLTGPRYKVTIPEIDEEVSCVILVGVTDDSKGLILYDRKIVPVDPDPFRVLTLAADVVALTAGMEGAEDMQAGAAATFANGIRKALEVK